jgi:hypothetical protein
LDASDAEEEAGGGGCCGFLAWDRLSDSGVSVLGEIKALWVVCRYVYTVLQVHGRPWRGGACRIPDILAADGIS